MNTAELREARLRALGLADTPASQEQFARTRIEDTAAVDQTATQSDSSTIAESIPASRMIDTTPHSAPTIPQYRVPDEHSRQRLAASISEAVAETVQASASMQAYTEDAPFSEFDAIGAEAALDYAATAEAAAPASTLPEEWACAACTYINQGLATPRCDMCGTRRVGTNDSSSDIAHGNTAGFEAEFGSGGSGGGGDANGVRAPDQTRHERLVGGDNHGWSDSFRAFFDDLLAPAPRLPPRNSPVSGDPLFDGLLRWVLGGALLGGALGGGAAWARGAGPARVRGAAVDGATAGALTGAAVGLDRRLRGDLDDRISDNDNDASGVVVAGGGGNGGERHGEGARSSSYGERSPGRFGRSSSSSGLLFAGDMNDWSPPNGLRRRIRMRGGSRRHAPGGAAAAGELVELIDMFERFHRPGQSSFLSFLAFLCVFSFRSPYDS